MSVMKRNGFTLTEVIAVIVILSVIILMAVPSYLGVTETLKKNQYDNKIKQISTKATEWATDNNITEDTTITIAKLVDDGYIDMDDETSDDKRVINPLNKESMECYHVVISIINGGYEVKVEESNDCELKILEDQEKNIKVTGYEINPETNTILNAEAIKLNAKEFEWTGKDVLLVTTSDVYKDPSSITFSTGSDNNTKTGDMYLGVPRKGDVINPDAYQNVFVVSASVILKAKYTITYDMVSERPRRTVTVKIDKENPNGSYSMLEKWGTSEAKKVRLSGNDGAGSGVKGFYVSALNTNDINTATYYTASNNEKEVSLPMGVYYFWTEDNVGNKSTTGERLEVTNIDDVAPQCVYKGMNSTWTNSPVTITWGCKDGESGCTTPEQSRTFNSGVVSSFTVPKYTITDEAGNSIECGGNNVDVMFDNVKPTCSTWKSHQDTPDGVTISVSCSDEGSGVNQNPSGDHGGQKSSQTYTVTDHAGNSNSYTVDVSSYQVYWHQDANSCRHINFGCDLYRYGTGAACGTYSCNCSNRGACTKYSYETGGGMGFSIYEGSSCPDLPACKDGPTSDASGNIVKCLASCTCIARARVCDTCNYSCRNAAFGCETESQGTGGAECGWHDVGWQRSSCSGNLCQVTSEQTWYT